MVKKRNDCWLNYDQTNSHPCCEPINILGESFIPIYTAMMSMSYTAGHIFSWPMSIAPAVNQLNLLDHLFSITKARSSVSQMRVCV